MNAYLEFEFAELHSTFRKCWKHEQPQWRSNAIQKDSDTGKTVKILMMHKYK